jgi:hypothetical protein
MTEPRRPPGLFSRAESGARAAVLALGVGVAAWVLGGVVMSGMAARLADRVGTIDDPTAAFLVGWALQRVWLWLALPGLAWAVGRWLTVSPTSFAVGAAATGELFGALLTSALGGAEALFLGWVDLAARVTTFALGVWLTRLAAAKGLAEAAARALAPPPAALSGEQRAAWEGFQARAGGAGPPAEAPAPTPPEGPASRG